MHETICYLSDVMSLEVRLILDQTIIEECFFKKNFFIEECLLFTFLSITMSSLIGLGYFCVCAILV